MDTKETARTDHLLEKVRLYMEKEKMAQQGSRILAGVSGSERNMAGRSQRFMSITASEKKRERTPLMCANCVRSGTSLFF